jgi:hypothetical protein
LHQKSGGSCPICKGSLDDKDIFPNNLLASVIMGERETNSGLGQSLEIDKMDQQGLDIVEDIYLIDTRHRAGLEATSIPKKST